MDEQPGPIEEQPNYSVGTPTPPTLPNAEAERAKAERARRKFFIGLGLAAVVGILLLAGGAFFFFLTLGRAVSKGLSGFPGQEFSSSHANVALIRVRGFMSCDLGPGASAETIVDQIHQATENPDIKVILLRLDTPGGTIASAQEIYAELLKAKAHGKKIVASMADVAASAGYYISTPADVIIADPGTATGSIGVIMETFDAEKLFNLIGVRFNTIKSGKFKDIGSYSRAMTPEERKLLQSDVMEMYAQFVHDVATSRHMPEDKVRKLADGRVYSGKQAKKLGLIDRLGNYQDALDVCKEVGHLQEVRLKEFTPEFPMERLLQLFAKSAAKGVFEAARDFQAKQVLAP